MAQRRMFSLKIVDTDAFLDMPLSTQALYFHLSMRADDDGFVSNPKRILKLIGSNEDELKLLFAKRFILPFESGVCVIKHWKIHNYIQTDRYQETSYLDEKNSLRVKENGSYTECIQNASKLDTQVRLGKDRLGKDREKNTDKPYSSLSYLSKIPTDDLLELSGKYDITEQQVKSKAEDLKNYCDSRGKRYKNYRAFLMNALKKDFGEKRGEKKPFFDGKELDKSRGEFVLYEINEGKPMKRVIDPADVVWK